MEENREPRINPSLYGQLIFDKGGRNIKWSKNSLFNKLRDLDKYKQKIETRPVTYTYTKINSIWIKDLSISHDTIKILEEPIGSKIPDISHSNIFVDISPRARKKGKK